ncbi:MAG: hypothetical protein KAJ19_28150, partial [Gammaproteobacteria bacterium]|nr:hypothetical protein [Gammaproteobacteria bacterium]
HRYYLLRDYEPRYDVSKYYLVPYVPENGSDNKVILWPGGEGVTFEHHTLGRKADNTVIPTVDMWVNPGDTTNKVIELTLRFDAENDGDFECVYTFGPYTTHLRNDAERVFINPGEQEGEPRDMLDENGGLVELTIRRVDDINESLIVYCGAFDRASWVETPYPTPGYREDPENGDSVVGTKDFLTIVVVIVVIALVGYLLYRWKKAGLPLDDLPEERPSKRKSKRKGGGGRRQRSGGKRRKSRKGKGSRRRKMKGGGGKGGKESGGS